MIACPSCRKEKNESNYGWDVVHNCRRYVCNDCLAKRARDYRKERTARGLCSCGNPPAEGYKECESCRDRRHRWRAHTKPAYIKWYAENKDRLAQMGKERKQKNKQAVMNHYGHSCACCGESEPAFLTVDHINGGGHRHRREIKRCMYEWLVKNNFPAGFRILCMNCNFSRGVYGYCPHERQLPSGEVSSRDSSAL